MPRLRVLFKCIAEAVCANGLRALAGVVPFGEVLYDVAGGVFERLRWERWEEEQRILLADVAQAPAGEVQAEAQAVAAEVAADQPEAVRHNLAHYLAQVPALVRQSLKRPADPTGLSVPDALFVNRPEDLLRFLPSRLPRFHPGDQPPGLGDWELTELLGVGGFGEVWKARHVFFDGIPPVALKFCLDPLARDRLLKHEASVLNRVMRHGHHPGLVPLLDAHLSSDPPCLKYEYVEGGDLAGLLCDWQADLRPGDRRHAERATRVIAQLAEIVGIAHRLSPAIVHRDLKPANVLVQRAEDGSYRLRVTDFGIGGVAALPAILEARQGTVTRGSLMGTSLRGAHTPLYASPQQMRGEPPDPRDDVHALGVIWYQLLIRDLGSGPPTGLWAEELEEMGLSRDLVRLLGACVASRPEKRPADAAALAEALHRLLPGAAPPRTEPKPVPVPPAPAVEMTKLERFLATGATQGIAWLLDLTKKGVGDEGVKALAASPHLEKLTALILSSNGLTDVAAEALAASPHLANLNRLVLWDNQITDAGVQALAASPYVSSLTYLDLGSNRVGDSGIEAIAASPHMRSLTALILVSNRIGDAGARALAASPHLDNLAELKPLLNNITAAGVIALKNRFGNRVRIY